MFKLLITILLFALIGCASAPISTIQKQRNLSGVTITWVHTTTEHPKSVMGELNTCTIYAPEPAYVADNDKMAIIGYEALKCFYGDFAKGKDIIANLNYTFDPNYKIRRNMNWETVRVDWIRTQPSWQDGGKCASPHMIGGASYSMGEGNLGCEEMTSLESCMIWVMEPSSENDLNQMARIGHEIVHCFFGEFHN